MTVLNLILAYSVPYPNNVIDTIGNHWYSPTFVENNKIPSQEIMYVEVDSNNMRNYPSQNGCQVIKMRARLVDLGQFTLCLSIEK